MKETQYETKYPIQGNLGITKIEQLISKINVIVSINF